MNFAGLMDSQATLPKGKTPARLPGGRNSNCGFSPIPLGRGRQKHDVKTQIHFVFKS
jgi:hypothetical protein